MNIREEVMSHAFTKFHLEGPWPFGAVLHRFTEPDLGDPHDHPWPFRSIILKGGYKEEIFDLENGRSLTNIHIQGDSFLVSAGHVHRIVDLFEDECWTLILPGEPERVPGFYQFREDGAYHRLWHEEEFKKIKEYLP